MQFSSLATAKEKATSDSYFVSVLDLGLSAKKNPMVHPQILDALDDLDKKSKNANVCLVELLDYSIGAGAREVLYEYITMRGKVMLPLLREKKKKPLACLPKYKSLCSDRETRDDDLDELIDAIEKGKVFRTDEE
jgi:hypothetical protein